MRAGTDASSPPGFPWTVRPYSQSPTCTPYPYGLYSRTLLGHLQIVADRVDTRLGTLFIHLTRWRSTDANGAKDRTTRGDWQPAGRKNDALYLSH